MQTNACQRAAPFPDHPLLYPSGVVGNLSKRGSIREHPATPEIPRNPHFADLYFKTQNHKMGVARPFKNGELAQPPLCGFIS
jgi:hypothetical protein